MKGYMRKQANSKAVKKHMRNGGMNSFNFHPSPRMVRSCLIITLVLLFFCYKPVDLFYVVVL